MRELFPLDGARGFGGDVVDHAVDSLDLFDDAVHHLIQQLPGQMHHFGGDSIDAVDGADGDNVVVGTLAVLDSDGFDRNAQAE